MNVWFVGDTHFGHRRITKYRPEFSSAKEHDDVILENILSTVKKRDVLWMMGDICFDLDSLENLVTIKKHVKQLNLVLGNHCHINFLDYVGKVDNLYGITKKYGMWLSHAPIHPKELFGKPNVHGHCHNNDIGDDRYFCVSMERIDYRPISLESVKRNLEKRENNEQNQ